MLNVKMNQNWIDQLMPDGFPFPSSTIISGPGGSGKPLIGSLFASSWLRIGGDITFLLINSDRAYAEKMLKIYNIQPEDYTKKIYYIDFDPNIKTIEKVDQNMLKANLLKPEVWDLSIKLASEVVKHNDRSNLVIGSALNLLFFSKTYRDVLAKKLASILQKINCIFSVSTNVFQDKIKLLEDTADNLMFARAESPIRLYLRISRMKDVSFLNHEVEVFLSETELMNIKTDSEKARKNLIPIISKI
jgi:KaiC/GvpD/RAD55 family RecA-like ATPase